MTAPAFTATWTAEIYNSLPTVIPARQFTWPQRVRGEAAAIARGALYIAVKPATGGDFLVTCALGFRDPALPSGIWTCPRPDDILAVVGGYAYLVDTRTPEKCLHLPLRPVTQVLPSPEAGLILLAGFNNVIAIGATEQGAAGQGTTGLLWETARLSYEGVTMSEVRDNQLHGLGWNMMTNREVPFVVDLTTGQHTGGGFGKLGS